MEALDHDVPLHAIHDLRVSVQRFLSDLADLEFANINRRGDTSMTKALDEAVENHWVRMGEAPKDMWVQGQSSDYLEPSTQIRRKNFEVIPNDYKHFRDKAAEHRRQCNEIRKELSHLVTHYRIIGGDESVVRSCKALRKAITAALKSIEKLLKSEQDDRLDEVDNACTSLRDLSLAVSAFHQSLYNQMHAFYFRFVSHWEGCLIEGSQRIDEDFVWEDYSAACLEYIFEDLLPVLNEAMKNVKKELITFGEKSLPMFVAEEKERATTRYINITTIATFFSSVTATALQFSLSYSGTALGGMVNFFWFVSLVFSVSSGISSLLGMSWRKSSIYETASPPLLIKFWLDKGPVVFLIIAASTFIIGLNLFAYLSGQFRYVSLATNIFTGIHTICLLIAGIWFICCLKRHSRWARGLLRLSERVRLLPVQCADTLKRWTSLETYVKELHAQRNVYWAFGVDHRVVELNFRVGWESDWPGPPVLSKVIRFVVRPAKKIFLLILRILTTTPASSDNSGEPLPLMTLQDEAHARYRRALERTFRSAEFASRIMSCVDCWTDGFWSDELLEDYLKQALWGYPELLKEFYVNVQPLLSESRGRNMIGQPVLAEIHIDPLGIEIPV